MLDKSANHRSRIFRPQRQRLAVAIGESVHFLGDDVGLFAHTARKQLRLFEDRCANFLVVVGAIVIIGMNNLRYHEVAEVRAGVRRNSLERRARVANNVRVRRAAQKMTQAKTHEAIFAALEEMLAHDQFIAAKLLIKLPHPDFAEVATSNPTTKLTRQREGWEWSWVRENAAGNPFDTAATWRLTVPVRTQGEEKGCLELYHSVNEGPFLLDINLLYKLFQRETARALARLQQTQPAASPQTALKEDALAPPVLGVYRQTAGGADSR